MTTIQSIGSPLVMSGVGRPGNTGLLESRLSRYETQLADWCHCPGGKTTEGQKRIVDLQQKADAIKEEIKQIEAARPGQQASANATVPPPRASQGYERSSPDSLIDVYA